MRIGLFLRPDGGIRASTIPEDHQLPVEMEIEFHQWKARRKGFQFLGLFDETSLPQSRRFRDCWRHDGEKLRVDMPLAREQRMNEIRRERNAKLDALDKEFMKALSTKQDTKALETKMQALRDIPQVVDLSVAKTPEELEAIQPAWPE